VIFILLLRVVFIVVVLVTVVIVIVAELSIESSEAAFGKSAQPLPYLRRKLTKHLCQTFASWGMS
jgi:hypothetical protein